MLSFKQEFLRFKYLTLFIVSIATDSDNLSPTARREVTLNKWKLLDISELGLVIMRSFLCSNFSPKISHKSHWRYQLHSLPVDISQLLTNSKCDTDAPPFPLCHKIFKHANKMAPVGYFLCYFLVICTWQDILNTQEENGMNRNYSYLLFSLPNKCREKRTYRQGQI